LEVRTALSSSAKPDDSPASLAIHLSDVATSRTRKEMLVDLATEVLLGVDRELSRRMEYTLLWALTESESR
jgi:hypothetical protein